MRPREYGLVVLSIIMAVVCARLGVWQVSRLHQRRAHNAFVAHRLGEPPVALAQLPRDTAELRFRRVFLHGAYDYAHQIVLILRTRNGSPGVNVLTPIQVAGSDTALLVNRGWVYAPDGVRNDLTPWREGDSVHAIGYAVPFDPPEHGAPRSISRPNGYRWIDLNAIKASIPYPVYPFIIVLEGDTLAPRTIMPRVPPPPLDEGPHLSYAIQWFAFTLISIGGMLIFVLRVRQREPDPLEE